MRDLKVHENFSDKDHPTDNNTNQPNTESNKSPSLFW